MHKRTVVLLLSVALFSLLISCGEAQLDYPEAKQVDQVDDYHGVQVADPYRWLEELDGEEIKAWVEAQNKLSRPYLEKIPPRTAIKDRLTQLWNYERFGIPFKEGGKYFYTKNDGLQNQSVLYVAASLDAEPRVLIDPNLLRKDATVSLRRYTVSPNGEAIAYALSDGGSDWTTWKVRNIETGADLADELHYTKFTGVSWSRGGKGFYYSRYPEGENGKGDGSKSVSIYYHRVGTDQSRDRQVYVIPDHPRHDPYGAVTEDGRYLVINVREGFNANAVRLMDLRQGTGKVVPLFDEWDARYNILGNSGSEFFVKTNKDAPLGRVVAVNSNRPDPKNWREVIPEAKETLQSAGTRAIFRKKIWLIQKRL